MDFLQNIFNGVFRPKTEKLRQSKISQLKDSISKADEEILFLTNAKSALIKAFDEFNMNSLAQIEKASQNEEKQSIQRILDRKEGAFLKDLLDATTQLEKSNSEREASIVELRSILTPQDDDFHLYKANVMIDSNVNYFKHLNFDCDVTQLSWDETCRLLSKAIDQGVLTSIDDRPHIIEEDSFNESVITLAKAVEENVISQDTLEKARLNIANLTPVRRNIVTEDGRVYTKTVYVKREEKAPEKAATFLAQQDVERNLQPGDRITAHFKGWSSGREYSAPNLRVKEINDDHIVAEFTEDYTPSGSSYTYGPNAGHEQGRRLVLPLTSSSKWNQAERFEKYIDPAVIREKLRVREQADAAMAAQDRERLMKTHDVGGAAGSATQNIETVDQIVNGDFIQITDTAGNATVKGVVRSTWNQGEGRARVEIQLEDGTRKYKQFPPRSGQFQKVINGQTTATDADGNVTVKNPTTLNAQMRDSLVAMGVTVRNYNDRAGVELFNQHFPNFDVPTLMSSLKADIQAQGIRNLNMEFRINGSRDSVASVEITGSGGFRMERRLLVENGKSKVYHAYFSVSSNPDVRDNGLGKKLFLHWNKQYRRAGVATLGVSANIDVGCYAWAQFGFTATKSTAKSMVNAISRSAGTTYSVHNHGNYRVDRQDAVEMNKIVDKFYESNSEDTRFPMHLLTAYKGGLPTKAVWVGNRIGWSGLIDLTDLKQRNRFEGYIQY